MKECVTRKGSEKVWKIDKKCNWRAKLCRKRTVEFKDGFHSVWKMLSVKLTFRNVLLRVLSGTSIVLCDLVPAHRFDFISSSFPYTRPMTVWAMTTLCNDRVFSMCQGLWQTRQKARFYSILKETNLRVSIVILVFQMSKTEVLTG